MAIERLEHSDNERITREDLIRLSEILYQGMIDRFLGPFFGDFSAFRTGTYDGVLWGCQGSTPGGDILRITKGAWIRNDTAITDAWQDTVQVGYKVADEDITIPDATAGFDRYDLISAPATTALLDLVAESAARNFKAPGATQFDTTNTPKRITHALANYTRTPGANVATGTGSPAANQPALPAGHVRIAVVRKRETNDIALQDYYDYRRFSGYRPPLKVHEHDNEQPAATKVAGHKNTIAGMCIPKAILYAEGAGTGVALTLKAESSTNIKSIARTADGNYTVTFYVPFGSALKCNGHGSCSVDSKLVNVNTNAGAGASAVVKIFTSSTAALYQLAAGEFISVAFYGNQE